MEILFWITLGILSIFLIPFLLKLMFSGALIGLIILITSGWSGNEYVANQTIKELHHSVILNRETAKKADLIQWETIMFFQKNAVITITTDWIRTSIETASYKWFEFTPKIFYR